MADREKVIKGIECCKEACGAGNCPYWNGSMIDGSCMLKLHADALALLKEQEFATEFILDYYQPTCKTCGFKPFVGYIPKIEWMKERGYKYCPRCGRAVKWDD